MPLTYDATEILRQVRKLEVKAKRLVAESFSGEYHSSFKGNGLDFQDFREYQPGDDVRKIDWHVTARSGKTYIRQFREERELSVILSVDVSASLDFGSKHATKRETAAQIAAIFAFSAMSNGDKVGLLLFASEPILYLPPAKGYHQVLRIVREILSASPRASTTKFLPMSQHLQSALRRKSLIFLLSDFLVHDFQKPLRSLAHRHELVAIRIQDPLERRFPKIGRLIMKDSESGQLSLVNSNNSNLRSSFRKLNCRFDEGLEQFFTSHRIDYAQLFIHRDYFQDLHRLMRRRSTRR